MGKVVHNLKTALYTFLFYKKIDVPILEGIKINTVNAWYKMGLDEKQIFYYGDDENWWGPAGETGPCGPDSEMFYINNVPNCSENCGPACSCGK